MAVLKKLNKESRLAEITPEKKINSLIGSLFETSFQCLSQNTTQVEVLMAISSKFNCLITHLSGGVLFLIKQETYRL